MTIHTKHLETKQVLAGATHWIILGKMSDGKNPWNGNPIVDFFNPILICGKAYITVEKPILLWKITVEKPRFPKSSKVSH
jgi:hypothetical protein